jgi:hypothetical protein
MTDLARTNQYNTWIDETTPNFTTQKDPTQRLRDWVDLFREVVKAAEFLSKTPFVPREMTGKAADVAACIMKGHELGMDPLDALSNIYVINGRVGMYAEFMRRRIIQSGHTFRIIESTDNRCVVEGTRKDGGEPQRASFTNEQARRAGIDLGKYPADKLVARATSRLCRQVFPDVLSGTLIAEDLIDGLIPLDEPAAPAEAEPAEARPALKRARKPRAPKATNSQAPTAAAATDDTDDLLDEPTPKPVAGGGIGSQTTAPPPATTQTPAAGMAPDDSSRENGTPPAAGYDNPIDVTPELPARPAQNRKMHAQFRELAVTDRDERLTITSEILGYTVDTSATLTITEASKLIDTLDDWYHNADYPVAERINDILNTAALREANEEEQDE